MLTQTLGYHHASIPAAMAAVRRIAARSGHIRLVVLRSAAELTPSRLAGHDPRPGVHVLVRLDTGPGGPDRPLVWCRRYGQGRVYYDALGHFSATWSNPIQVTLASGGIAWAAGLVAAPTCRQRTQAPPQ